MNNKYYFTLAEAARLFEINARKLSSDLDGVVPVLAFRFNNKFIETLYSFDDIVKVSGWWDNDSGTDEIKKIFILPDKGGYAVTITEASRLTGKSGNWIHLLIQTGRLKKFEGRRIKDAHKKKSLIYAKDLSILGLDFKPDDVLKLFTLVP